MAKPVQIVECPRDAWQALPVQIPAARKAAYLRSLIRVGFTSIDAVSFVSPAAVPQMADSEEVLRLLGPVDGVELIGIVVNQKGAERAIKTGAVQTLGFPYSISPEFLRRNQNQTPQQALAVLESIAALARAAGLHLVAYVSMAFGNPYGDAWSVALLEDACAQLIASGVKQISLADTVGLAAPARVAETLAALLAAHTAIEIGAHLHARPQDASAKIRAAYDAGCRRFDAAIGGLGGCPFAQDALVGNLATETLLAELNALGAHTPALHPLDELTRASAALAQEFGNPAH
jgi:hydroxymethylglutaryl-CoA lyase